MYIVEWINCRKLTVKNWDGHLITTIFSKDIMQQIHSQNSLIHSSSVFLWGKIKIKTIFEMPNYSMLLKNSTILTHGSSEAQMGRSFHVMKTHEQLLAIVSNDFIWFCHTMSWPHHLGPSVRMAGSPQAWWQATGQQQSGTGRRKKVGGAELAEYCRYQTNTSQQLDWLSNLPFCFPMWPLTV